LAFVEFELGAVSKYPGYYTANNGFLDDAMFIQDGRFYQIYSYIVRVDEKLEAYKAAVKTMIHPAGTALFGEYTITNEFDLSADLESMLKSLIIILRDTIAAADAKDHFDVQKALGLAGSFSGLELAVPIESHIIHMDKPLTDSVTISEVSVITPVNFNVDKLFEDTTDPVVDAKDHFIISKVLTDVLDAQIDATSHLFEKSLDGYDSITLSDNTVLYLNGEALYYKYDTEVILDSGGQIWFDNYLDDMTLFENDGSNDYMVGKITF